MNIHTLRTAVVATSILALSSLSTARLDARGGGGGAEQRIECKAKARRGPEMGADYRESQSRQKFSVEVTRLADTGGLEATVIRGGSVVFGPAAIPEEFAPAGGANGIADLNLDTQNGNLVPSLQSGDVVSVSQNGAGLLSCTLN